MSSSSSFGNSWEYFIAKIKDISVTNAKVTMTVTNWIDAIPIGLVNLSQFPRELKYKLVPTKNHTHPKIDNVWKSKILDRFFPETEESTEYFEASPYSTDYDVQFAIKSVSIPIDRCFEMNRIYTVHIPAYSAKDTSVSHLYLGANLIDYNEIEQNVLIQRNDQQSIDVYNAIKCGLPNLLMSDKKMLEFMVKYRIIYNHDSVIGFVTKNIFDFLFESQFKYKVSCLEDSPNHGNINFGNIHQKHLQNIQETLQNNRDHFGSFIDVSEVNKSINESNILCHWCGLRLRSLELCYSCDITHNNDDAHYYCLNCINTVVRLNGELKNLLTDSLKDILIDDCIQCIADYAVGGVILSEYRKQ